MWRTIWTVLLVCLLALGCNASTPAAAPVGQGSAAPGALATDPTAAAAGDGTEAVAQAEAPAEDRYPALMFGLLNPTERTRFVRLAEAELCPCDGAPQSLDACLQTPLVCELATQTAAQMMRMIKEGAQDLQILDGAQQLVANARRVHTFSLDATPWKGAETPVLTIVEFADFECPACRDISNQLRAAMDTYGDRVRLYFKHFPLPSHPHAQAAAVASLAAHRQNQFWGFHDRVFDNQARLRGVTDPRPLFLEWAAELGINENQFARDLDDPALQVQVATDRDEGTRAGIQGTPTLFINGVMVMDVGRDGIAGLLRDRLAAQ